MKRVLALLALVACAKGAPPAAPPATPPPTPPVAAPSPVDGIDLPVLEAAALPPITAQSPLLVATKASLVFDGAVVIALENGVVTPADKEGGVLGVKISKLVPALDARRFAGQPRLQLALDRTLTYKLMIEIMFSAKQPEAGWKDFTLLAKQGNTVVGFPITLPDRTDAVQVYDVRGGKAAAPRPLGLFVSVTKTEVLVWSTSGTEGTLRDPKARLAPTATSQLATVLAEIAKRYPGEKTIALQADGATSMQQVAGLLAAIKPVFPDVVFSRGFE